MDRKNFNAELTKKMANEWNGERAFVSDGHPIDCQVMIVGVNPATSMKFDFSQFWDDETGFKKAEWYHQYLNERNQKPSKTRKGLNIISDTLANECSVKVLETNAIEKATKSVKELEEKQKSGELTISGKSPYKWFFENLPNLKIVLIHGNDAADIFKKDFGIELKRWDLKEPQILINDFPTNQKIKIVFMQHLQFQMGDLKWKQVANGLKKIQN